MRLATFLPPEDATPRAGEVRGDHVIAYPLGTTVLDCLLEQSQAPDGQGDWPLEAVTLLAPVPRPPAIFGIGVNYAAHAKETGQDLPEAPIVFTKLPTSAAPPGAPLAIPPPVRRLDYEGELCVVMGARGEVAGYAVADDVTGRDLQGREPQWTRAKGADGFCPYGPWLTTVDDVPDPHALGLRTWVNGDLRQDSSTSDMIFKVNELVDFISEVHRMAPGELILTGTPNGVGMSMDPPRFLQSGDVVRIEIERLGWIEHPIG